MIRIQGLSHRYSGAAHAALDGLDLVVPDNSLFGLLGPNGSGKSTLLSILSGILPCPKGKVFIGGRDLAREPALVQSFSALVPQGLAFYGRLSVRRNLEFFAGARGLGGADARERVRDSLRATALEAVQEQTAERCSGGVQRRLNIAVALLSRPRLLLLDEPTVGLDPQSRAFILEGVRAARAQGTTVVYASHYMEEVQALCDSAAVLEHGRVLAKGSLLELIGQGPQQAEPTALEALFLRLTHRGVED